MKDRGYRLMVVCLGKYKEVQLENEGWLIKEGLDQEWTGFFFQ